jgi:hypothetical protein
MIVRSYMFLWSMVIVTANSLYIGEFSLLMGVIFGFICLGLTLWE